MPRVVCSPRGVARAPDHRVVCLPPLLGSADENPNELDSMEINEILVRLAVLYGPSYVDTPRSLAPLRSLSPLTPHAVVTDAL